MAQQLPLFPLDTPPKVKFPSTRYQGSKRKLVEWIGASTADLKFSSVLDVFGGTGVVSHYFKQQGKQIFYNDVLRFNWWIGVALIENSIVTLTDQDVEKIILSHGELEYPSFIQDTFEGIYFTKEENAWLDRIIHNINHQLTDRFKQAVAWFALFQSCMIKRPYNLFHRANLYMREASVQRSFGNKTTWDTPFETHFRAFVAEANRAVVDNGRQNIALNVDALQTPTGLDVVYIDPPYLNVKGVGVDYHAFYHFLEGMVQYERWDTLIDHNTKNLRLQSENSEWNNPAAISNAFEKLIAHHQHSTLVLSYRDDGIPTKNDILELLHVYKRDVKVMSIPQKYVLSKQSSHELLFIAR